MLFRSAHLRCVLRDQDVAVVLHGHKHTDYVYYDYVYGLPDPDLQRPHRLLVVSAPFPGPGISAQDAVCRLITVPAQEYASRIEVTTVPAVPAGQSLRVPRGTPLQVWQPALRAPSVSMSETVIEGSTVDEAYERALSLFEARKCRRLHNLVCRVMAASNPVQVPSAYPHIEAVPDDSRDAWFQQRVSWWQKPTFQRIKGDQYFTHGSRIYCYTQKVNQFESAINALIKSPTSSRAVVSLIKPGVDTLTSGEDKDRDPTFPSFCFLQFLMRDCGDSTLSLECIAYFRKQEMRYWWPVNVAEIAKLQWAMRDRTGDAIQVKHHKTVVLGSITTFAAIAEVGSEIPKVSIPAIDCDLEDSPNALWDLAYSLFWTEIESREAHFARWGELLKNLVPPVAPHPDGVPVPVEGVSYLAERCEYFAAHHPGGGTRVASILRELEGVNRAYARKLDRAAVGDDPNNSHREWREQVLSILSRVRDEVSNVFGRTIAELW